MRFECDFRGPFLPTSATCFAIERGKRAIVDGEVFQVVISRRFEIECDASPLDVYRILRTTNPSPYMYLFSLEDSDGRGYSIVGSSPEALVTVTGDEVITQGGLIGKVSRVEDAQLEVEIAPGVKVKIVRATVSNILSKTEPAPEA